ncbi:hypothetical protein [uncultured Roseovarius sp.]|uniref:hypothetical protein n=1 Tax=uncultured Roseovarius sp. TaxID=293344 RepID=UPI00262AE4B2|nr:hypothetical protein [uncultured Roseovarius sp.]
MPRVALTGQIMLGIVKVVNFAHGACFMMGAFISYLLLFNLGMGYWGRSLRQASATVRHATTSIRTAPDPRPIAPIRSRSNTADHSETVTPGKLLMDMAKTGVERRIASGCFIKLLVACRLVK